MSNYTITLLVDGERDQVDGLASWLFTEDVWPHLVDIEEVRVHRVKYCGNCQRTFRTRFGAFMHAHKDALP